MLTALAQVYGEDIGEVRLEGYVEALADVELPALQLACQLALQQLKWFPQVAELRALTWEWGRRWRERCPHTPRCQTPNWCAVMRDKDAAARAVSASPDVLHADAV
jgi:hypothetical protein